MKSCFYLLVFVTPLKLHNAYKVNGTHSEGVQHNEDGHVDSIVTVGDRARIHVKRMGTSRIFYGGV